MTPPAPDSSGWRDRLRALPVLDGDFPDPGLARASDDPMPLVATWLDEAIGAGIPAPHVANLATSDSRGRVTARMLIVKDLDADAIWFSSSANSPKGRELAENPRAALTLYWPSLGRQIRLEGPVDAPSAEVSAADFLRRGRVARRELLVDRQSTPRGADADALIAEADARLDADPEVVAPSWTAYRLTPDRVEFWAARTGAAHLRYSHERTADGWRREQLWT